MLKITKHELYKNIFYVFKARYEVEFAGLYIGSYYELADREEFTTSSFTTRYYVSHGGAITELLNTVDWYERDITDAINEALELEA